MPEYFFTKEETGMKTEERNIEPNEKLNSDELKAASGGTGKPLADTPTFTCPKCGSDNITSYSFPEFTECICNFCGYQWIVF